MKLYTPLDNIHTNHLDVFVWGKQVLFVNVAMQLMLVVRKVLVELLQACWDSIKSSAWYKHLKNM